METVGEKAMVYGGMVGGALAPIVAIRYTIFLGLNGNPAEELFAWGGSLFLNISTIVAPVYVAGMGGVVGDMAASASRRNRLSEQSELEK